MRLTWCRCLRPLLICWPHCRGSSVGISCFRPRSEAKARLDELMRVELPDFEPFVIHDIRRTMRTHLSALPIPDMVRELVIAHAQPGLHKVYDQHSYLKEKRRALDLWAARLSSIVTPQPNVVPLRI